MNIAAGTDPFELFQSWYDEAVAAEINDPDAIALASVDPDGMPSVRMVLLRQWSDEGFFFFTNYESRKSGELLATGKAAFCIHWKSLRRQIRIEGPLEEVSSAEADAYFHSRPRVSQIGSAASDQSRALPDRQVYLDRVTALEERYPEGNIPRPPHWTGFRLSPRRIEFWQDRQYRLHDRRLFVCDAAEEAWFDTLLYP